MCPFVTFVYIEYWFQTPSSVSDPRNDLALLCKLSSYPNNFAKDATTAFNRHLWYLSELLVGFDSDVSTKENKLMVLTLTSNSGSAEPPKHTLAFVSPDIKGS